MARPGTGAGATEGPGAGPDIRAERVPSPHKRNFSIDGSMLQEPLLPRWLLAAVSALVALALLLLILWFALFKPQIKSTAQNQVNKQLTANGITPVTSSGASKTGSGAGRLVRRRCRRRQRIGRWWRRLHRDHPGHRRQIPAGRAARR